MRERLARGYISASAENGGWDDPDEPVVVSERDWLAAIAIAKRIYADYLDLMSRAGPEDDHLYAAVELFVDSHDYDPDNLLRYAVSRGINIITVGDLYGLSDAVYALLWAYTEAEVLAETPEPLD